MRQPRALSTNFEVTGRLSQAQIDDINTNSSWNASSEFTASKTNEELTALAGTFIVPNPFPKVSFGALTDHTDIPPAFDSRLQWPGCIGGIQDTGKCNSCWAFAASDALSDRFSIKY